MAPSSAGRTRLSSSRRSACDSRPRSSYARSRAAASGARTTFPRYLAWVSRQESGLDRDGWVKADQLFTRPIDTLGPRLGRLNPAAMTRVDASLRFVLGL